MLHLLHSSFGLIKLPIILRIQSDGCRIAKAVFVLVHSSYNTPTRYSNQDSGGLPKNSSIRLQSRRPQAKLYIATFWALAELHRTISSIVLQILFGKTSHDSNTTKNIFRYKPIIYKLNSMYTI